MSAVWNSRAGEHQLPVDRHALALERHRRRASAGSSISAEAALRRDQLRDLGEMRVGVAWSRTRRPARRGPAPATCAASGLRVVDDVMRAELRAPTRCVSGREAVAITVRSVSCRASWIAIEPTPPAPPMISMAGCRARHRLLHLEPVEQHLPGGDRGQRQRGRLRRSRGDVGLRPTMRSSTR